LRYCTYFSSSRGGGGIQQCYRHVHHIVALVHPEWGTAIALRWPGGGIGSIGFSLCRFLAQNYGSSGRISFAGSLVLVVNVPLILLY